MFLDWITRPAAVGEFCATISNLPPLQAVGRQEPFRTDPLFRFGFKLGSGENVFGPPQMPVWPRYLSEIRRAEDYAVFGRREPAALLREVDRRMEGDLSRTLREAR